MRSLFSHLNELWGYLAIEELIRSGVNLFCISPGARSTPLAFAVSQNRQAKPVIHFDERGAAYYALGYTRAAEKPAVVISTSGTAAANFLPAIVEASVDHVPLLVLTADRPPELRQAGANQSIDQMKIFGNYVRWEMDIPCPDEKIAPEFVLTTIDQAVYRASHSPAGPVHLNFMFREPLAPTKEKKNFRNYLALLEIWNKSRRPQTSYSMPISDVADHVVKEIAKKVTNSKLGLIIAGKMNGPDAQGVLKLSEKIDWPIFADIASGLRLGVKNSNVISHFDLILLSESSQKFKPETVLHFGKQPVSKRVLQFLESVHSLNYIRVADHPNRLDPNHQITLRIESDISEFCAKIAANVHRQNKYEITNRLVKLSEQVDAALGKLIPFDNNSLLTEPAAARLISQQISKGGALFLASSLPVREMDVFAISGGAAVPVEYNRGVSGIDGTIATAVGYANGLKKPVTLLTGDLAFLHDLNSLALVRESNMPISIVVLNNDGGGIFSFLPVAEIGNSFEKFFGTPHGLSFETSAQQFEIHYGQPKTVGEFSKIYSELQKKKKSGIIEVKTSRQDNFELHQRITRKIRALLGEL